MRGKFLQSDWDLSNGPFLDRSEVSLWRHFVAGRVHAVGEELSHFRLCFGREHSIRFSACKVNEFSLELQD